MYEYDTCKLLALSVNFFLSFMVQLLTVIMYVQVPPCVLVRVRVGVLYRTRLMDLAFRKLCCVAPP